MKINVWWRDADLNIWVDLENIKYSGLTDEKQRIDLEWPDYVILLRLPCSNQTGNSE